MIDQGSSINMENFQGESKSIYKDWGFYTCKRESTNEKRIRWKKIKWIIKAYWEKKIVKEREYSMEGVKEIIEIDFVSKKP